MMVIGRALAALAALFMLAAVLLNLVPTSSAVSEDGGPGRRLSCGTLFFTTESSFSDACQDARIPRIMSSLVAWLAGLVLGTAGLVVLHLAVHHL
jgi:hypothetical protein